MWYLTPLVIEVIEENEKLKSVRVRAYEREEGVGE